MKKTDILKISIYQIQMFLSVAKTESITDSAKDLHLSPSMLSKNISKMEEELELMLFRREKGKLHLTPAGRVMKEELKTAVETVELGIEKARVQQAVETPPVRIGFPNSVSRGRVLFPALNEFRAQYSHLDYQVELYDFRDLIDQIRKGNLDVIFTTLFEEPSVKALGLDSHVLIQCPLLAYVTEENPLAHRLSVTVKDLEQMKQILPYPEKEHNFYKNVIDPLFQDQGFIMRVKYYSSSADAVMMNIRHADEVIIGDENQKIDSLRRLIGIPITDTKSGIILAWKSSCGPAAKAFVKCAVSYWKAANA